MNSLGSLFVNYEKEPVTPGQFLDLSDDETPSYKLSANNYSADDEEKRTLYASGTSFNQHLLQQLNTYRFEDEEEEKKS